MDHQLLIKPMLLLQALQDASNQILATGYRESSDKIFHMSCHGVLVYGFPQVVYATKFAAQLVFYKLGEAARRQQLAWFHSASDHTHWQVARGYWFESMAHQVLSNGGEFPFRLLGKCMVWLVCILLVHLPIFDSDTAHLLSCSSTFSLAACHRTFCARPTQVAFLCWHHTAIATAVDGIIGNHVCCMKHSNLLCGAAMAITCRLKYLLHPEVACCI